MIDVPELLAMVLSHLSTRDLARCMLVNKQWCDASTRLLWHTISCFGAHQKILQRMVLEDYLQARKILGGSRNVEFKKKKPPCQGVFKIEVSAEPRVWPYQSSLLKYGPFIKHIENPQDLFHGWKLDSAMPSENELLSHFVKYCVNIQQLTLDICHQSDESHRIIKGIAGYLAPHLRGLSMRCWFSHKSGEELYLHIISRCSPKLEKLEIYDRSRPVLFGDVNLKASEKGAISDIALSGLKELVLDQSYSTGDLSSWDCFWKSCGNVERLELRSLRHEMTDHMVSRIRDYLPKLNSIVLEDMPHQAILPLLSDCRESLKYIQTDVPLTQDSSAAVAKHCPSLEELHVTQICRDSSKTLHYILLSSPKLRVLVTSHDDLSWRFRGFIPFIVAKDFIDEDPHLGSLNSWACEQSLRVLKTKVVGIPRPDVPRYQRRHRISHVEAPACEGKRLQHRVYERLSRFTNLEELCLGHDALTSDHTTHSSDGEKEGSDFQYECLDMTLESGLDQLKKLKNLKVLDVQWMEQCIGVKEVEWMTLHWPQLREIRGLFDSGCNFKATEWLRKNAPMVKVKVTFDDDCILGELL